MPTTRTRLTEAIVEGVLGEYTHSVVFPESDSFVILYGPNGIGKTKFLEVISAVTTLDGRKASRLPFDRATLRYADGSRLIAVLGPSREAGKRSRTGRPVTFHLEYGGRTETWEHDSRTGLADFLETETTWREISPDYWEDRADGEVVRTATLESRYDGMIRDKQRLGPIARSFRMATRAFIIETQRLRTTGDTKLRRARPWDAHERLAISGDDSQIEQQSTRMRQLINLAQTEHSVIAQELDRDFPSRVMERGNKSLPSPGEVIDKYNEQNELRIRLARLASADLSNALSLPRETLDGVELRLLSQYVEDTERKLIPFVGLLNKIELLEEIVNSRLLKKRLQVTAKEGLTITHVNNDRRIDLDALSSGEQHEIILMFDLLFSVTEDSLVMVDEPEISLHVAWQLAFIPDIQRIARLTGLRFMIATHSPQIINGRWDQAVRLGPSDAAFA